MWFKYYCWIGVDVNGYKVGGNILAASYDEAKANLSQQNITVLEIKFIFNRSFFRKTGRINSRVILDFCQQWYALENAGIPLLTTLSIIKQSTSNRSLQNLLSLVKLDLERGKTLSAAFQNKSIFFDQLFCRLLKIGEESGTLDLMLFNLISYQEKSLELKRKLGKALLYPSVVLIVTVIVTLIMLVMVIPQFSELYQSFNAKLPAYTQFIISLANHLKKIILPLILSCFGLVFGIIWLHHKIEKWALRFDYLVLRLPILGKLLTQAILAKLTRIWAITLKAGLPLHNILVLITDLTNNRVFKQVLQQLNVAVSQGQAVSIVLQTKPIIPTHVVQMIKIGEESGNLDTMLLKIANYYTAEINHFVDNLSNLLEPILMIILGIIIGGLIIGMYLPIFRLGNIL